MPPDSGTFRIGGETRIPAMRRLLGVVFQAPSLDRKLTVLENVRLQGHLYGLSGAPLERAAAGLLERLGVADRKGDLVETLSGGLARRVEIAKALLHGPRVILLDEPSTGLDPGARRDLRAVLLDLARRDGAAVLLTTHLFEEADAADRVAILDRGRLVAEGSPAELKARVGGDVLSVETAGEEEARRLASEVIERFDGSAGAVSALGTAVRVERPAAHEFVPALVEAFPGRFRSVTLGAPTLEDVFVDRTGHRFEELGGPA
jgi:ABC-2 type transport system ATP-binding protein